MLLTALTALLVVAWYAFVTAGEAGSLSTRLVLAAAGASGQIVVCGTLLGTLGALSLAGVTGFSLITAGILLVLALRSAGDRSRLAAAVPGDLRELLAAVKSCWGWETALLTAFLAYAGVWLATAVVHYPPRGVDDLVYHLPPIYQAVQTHRFEVLPLELRKFFVFPFNGEMPFLWVALLTGSARWVDGTQVLFAALGVAAVFALGRALGLRPRGALFAAALFGAMPVVLLQATSNYVDVVVNAWILAAAVALLAYQRTGSSAALVVGGLTTGLVLGSKYQAILIAAFLAGIALVALLGRGLRGARLLRAAALFALPAASAGLFWYVRNGIVHANPFYPLPVSLLSVTLFPGDWPQGPSVWSALLKDPVDVLRIAVWDPGLRTFNGGLGFVFWGLGLAAWARLLARRLRGRDAHVAQLDGHVASRDAHVAPLDGHVASLDAPVALRGSRPWLSARVLVLGLVPVGIFSLFLTPFADLALTPRYVLAIGGIAFVALALAIEEAAGSRTGAATGMRAAGVLGAALGLVVAAGSNRPLLDLSPVAAETPQVRRLGEMHYLPYGLRALGLMAEGWAPLDAMTRDGGGLIVYQATDFKIFWTSPTFGTDLQNRIWNFLDSNDRPADPDAFFFHSPSREPLYLGKEIRRETVAADPRYELVASNGDDVTTLYVLRARLAEKGRRQRLVDYYATLRPTLVRETAPAAQAAKEGSVLLATFPLASAFLVHEAQGRLRAELIPVTTKELQAEGARRSDRPVYTLGVSLDGRRVSVVGDITVLGQAVSIVRNEPVASGGAAPGASGGDHR